MNLSPEQKKKIERVARHMEDKNIAIVEDFMELGEKVMEMSSKIKDNKDVLDKLDKVISIVDRDDEQDINITLKIV